MLKAACLSYVTIDAQPTVAVATGVVLCLSAGHEATYILHPCCSL